LSCLLRHRDSEHNAGKKTDDCDAQRADDLLTQGKHIHESLVGAHRPALDTELSRQIEVSHPD
jgi:hypothetical protein